MRKNAVVKKGKGKKGSLKHLIVYLDLNITKKMGNVDAAMHLIADNRKHRIDMCLVQERGRFPDMRRCQRV